MQISHEMYQEPQRNVPSKASAVSLTMQSNPPLTIHHSPCIVSDCSEHIHILVHPPMFPKLAVILRVIQVR